MTGDKHPGVTSDVMATFIFNESGVIYSRVDISRYLEKIKITQKLVFTEVYKVFTPQTYGVVIRYKVNHLYWALLLFQEGM